MDTMSTVMYGIKATQSDLTCLLANQINQMLKIMYREAQLWLISYPGSGGSLLLSRKSSRLKYLCIDLQ